MRRSGPVHAHFLYNCAMPRVATVILLVLASCCPVAHATAEGDSSPAAPHQATRVEGLTLDEAVARAEKKYKARAVRAEEKTDDGRRVYRIRLLSSDGRVFDITIDAASGKED